MTLQKYLMRMTVLALYRQALRCIRQASDPATRSEMRSYARHEFDRQRAVDSTDQIRFLVSTGREVITSMEQYILNARS
ncbi:putative complex 1 protein [Rosellinia necatrix]|uniref:LYR motif-containing protein 2 n=1 Tax=Rosellinia necatrix TaxID=77044 RepID=A0A1S8A6B1_ROSNE|nr:putative complex 1 protein [Rosellinia necatrix]